MLLNKKQQLPPRKKKKLPPYLPQGYEWLLNDKDFTHEFEPSKEELGIAAAWQKRGVTKPWFVRGTIPRPKISKRRPYLPALLRDIEDQEVVTRYKSSRNVYRALRNTGRLEYLSYKKKLPSQKIA